MRKFNTESTRTKVGQKIGQWICLGSIAIPLVYLPVYTRPAKADIWGADVGVLMQILVQSIQTVAQLQSVLKTARETTAILDEMNRGVKEVLRLADTAHLPLPPQVYETARQIDQATQLAKSQYGIISDRAPLKDKNEYRNGVEGLFISQDAFDYSTFLDQKGESVKSSAVVANQASATRLTAETLGVVLHAISHSNRIQAKTLQIESTRRVEDSAKDAAQFDNFLETQSALRSQMEAPGFTRLSSPFDSPGGAQ